jgi:hypothetical protein
VLLPAETGGAVIACTADPAKADKRTRSKWSRVMRYAAVYKSASEALDQFIQRKGGINACAAVPRQEEDADPSPAALPTAARQSRGRSAPVG